MTNILVKCLNTTLIITAVATFLNLVFVQGDLNIRQLGETALIVFGLITCYEFFRKWLKTRGSQ
ncbi:hypothetical protein [Methylobacter sp.]